MKECPICHKKFESGKFCPDCGESLQEIKESLPSSANVKKAVQIEKFNIEYIEDDENLQFTIDFSISGYEDVPCVMKLYQQPGVKAKRMLLNSFKFTPGKPNSVYKKIQWDFEKSALIDNTKIKSKFTYVFEFSSGKEVFYSENITHKYDLDKPQIEIIQLLQPSLDKFTFTLPINLNVNHLKDVPLTLEAHYKYRANDEYVVDRYGNDVIDESELEIDYELTEFEDYDIGLYFYNLNLSKGLHELYVDVLVKSDDTNLYHVLTEDGEITDVLCQKRIDIDINVKSGLFGNKYELVEYPCK